MKNQYARKWRSVGLACVIVTSGLAAGCGPEVGSEEWCEEFEQTSASDITPEDGENYAKHCLMGQN